MRRRGHAEDQRLRRTAWRIGLQTAAGVAVTVLVLASVATLVVLHSQREAQNTLMRAAIQRADDVVDPPAGVWLIVLKGGSLSASPGLPSGLPDTAQLTASAEHRTSSTRDVRVHGREYRVRTQPYGRDGAIQVVLDLHSDHEERARLWQALLLVGALGLVLAAAAGAWLARRSVAPLAASLALQRRFVADAGHELRTPVTLLSTRAQLIRRRARQHADPAVLETGLDSLVHDAETLTELLDDLLLAADPRERPTTERVDLARLTAEVAEAVRPAADERGVTVAVHVADHPYAIGTPVSLRRAVTALLDNAIRHARTAVRLDVHAQRRHSCLDISDDGPGIAVDILPRIFERFAAAPADGATGGRRRYGLGLALVSDIVARHGGTVSASSSTSGARFRVLLPGGDARPHRHPKAVADSDGTDLDDA